MNFEQSEAHLRDKIAAADNANRAFVHAINKFGLSRQQVTELLSLHDHSVDTANEFLLAAINHAVITQDIAEFRTYLARRIQDSE